MTPSGDFFNKMVWSNSAATTSSSGYWITTSTDPSYNIGWPGQISPCYEIEKTSVSEQSLNDAITAVVEELSNLNLKYRIFDSQFALCEVIAAKMLHARLPKKCVEFAVSDKLPNLPGTCNIWRPNRRNTFLIVKLDGKLDPNTLSINTADHAVDICAKQHGGPQIQALNEQTALPWKPAFRYKTAASLVKRLLKEGHPLKELHLKDAIALSTRYAIVDQPSEIDIHQINPKDDIGRKFLERFGKEVGFKTTLAQLLLDADPGVAAKAKEIAQIILLR